LKQGKVKPWMYLAIPFIEPIRNWNPYQVSPCSSTRPPFIEPIRNWNRILWQMWEDRLFFHWTYKELKRQDTIHSRLSVCSFIEPIRNWNAHIIYGSSDGLHLSLNL